MRHVAARGRVLRELRSAVHGASYRRLLLAGAAGIALAPLPAQAFSAAELGLRGALPAPAAAPVPLAPVETVTAAAAPAPAAPASAAQAPASEAPGPDGLGPRDVYLEADTLIDDPGAKTMTARGSVEARYQGRVLRANEVVYNTETGAAVARGDAVIVNADGTTEYAQEVVLDDEMKAGVATAFAARLQDNVTIAAGAAIRRNQNVNELRKAIYTPCDICNEEGYKTPTWSVQASKILQDTEHHVIYYRDAVIRVKGVPVFYTPIFWHPDPSAERRSGFLTPRIRYNARLGLSYEQPYLWVLSPSADLTIAPQFHTEVAPLLNVGLRKRFWSGQMNLRAGWTYEQRFDSVGKYGNKASRMYVLGDGLFQLDDKWRWGFGIENVSDKTLFARYQVEDVFLRRGPFTVDSQRLLSQAYAERQDETSFLSISAVKFQTLRVLQQGRTLVSYDNEDAFPFVGPLVEARYDPKDPVLGGRLRLLGNAVMLSRDTGDPSKYTPAGLTQNQGVDYRRASGQIDWRASATLSNGMRVEPFALGRADAYSIDNPRAAKPDATFTRAIGTVGADFSWPFIRQTGASSLILEPLAQVAISPDHRPNLRVPNEDSVSLEFDETNLFSPNRFTGFDLYEGGQRLNVGGRATYTWGAGRRASLLLGRSFRTDPDPAFYRGSGLEGGESDWVASAVLEPVRGVALFTRSRFDADTLRVRRQEAGVDLNVWRVSTSVRYLYNERDLTGLATQSVNVGATLNLTRNWGVSYVTQKDLEQGVTPLSQFTIFYQDECLRVDVIFTHDDTVARTIVPSNSVQVRLTLATLGGQGR